MELWKFRLFPWFVHSDGPLTNFATDIIEISIISSNKGGNRRKISGFYGIFQISPWSTQVKVPKPRYPSHANSRDKESLNSSTQPNPSQAWGAAWGAAQARFRSAALPSDYITRPVALVQHCIAAEEQHRGAAGSSSSSRRLRSISLVCVLCNMSP